MPAQISPARIEPHGEALMLGTFFDFFCLALAVPYAVAVATPSWRWLLTCSVLVGGLLAYGWSVQIAAWQHPDFIEERLPLGSALLEMLTISFAAGVAIRGLSLALARLAARPRWATRTTVSLLGFAVLCAALALPAASSAWQQRPVSEACRRATFDVELAGEHFKIPAAPLFDVSLGRGPDQGAYDLGNVASLREFCALTDTGRHQLHATGISMKFQQISLFGRSFCGPNIAAWKSLFCSTVSAEGGRSIDDSDFPASARVFSLLETDLGASDVSASGFDVSRSGEKPRQADTVVRSPLLTPDGKSLTFTCSGLNHGNYSCVATYPWRQEAYLSYVFRSDYASIEERGRRVDATTREFVGRLRVGG
jgi:hypothetical protein